MSKNIDRVKEFCVAFGRRDTDALLTFFTEDAVYHNMPMAAVRGKDAIRSVLDMFLKPAERVEFEVLCTAESGETVFTERVDRFVIGGRTIELPLAGVFEMRDGQIAAWRDYFDMATWTKQAAPS